MVPRTLVKLASLPASHWSVLADVLSTSGIVESDRLPVVFTAVASGAGASGGSTPLEGVKFLGVFLEFVVASIINIVLVLKQLKIILLCLGG